MTICKIDLSIPQDWDVFHEGKKSIVYEKDNWENDDNKVKKYVSLIRINKGLKYKLIIQNKLVTRNKEYRYTTEEVNISPTEYKLSNNEINNLNFNSDKFDNIISKVENEFLYGDRHHLFHKESNKDAEKKLDSLLIEKEKDIKVTK